MKWWSAIFSEAGSFMKRIIVRVWKGNLKKFGLHIFGSGSMVVAFPAVLPHLSLHFNFGVHFINFLSEVALKFNPLGL